MPWPATNGLAACFGSSRRRSGHTLIAPANPPEQHVLLRLWATRRSNLSCSDWALCFGSSRRRSRHTCPGPCEPAGAVYCPAQDTRAPHGPGRRSQPAMICADSLRASARHGVAAGTRSSATANPPEQFIVLLRTKERRMVTASAASQPTIAMCGLAARFRSPRRRTHALVPASRPAGQFGTIILTCKKWRDNFGKTT